MFAVSDQDSLRFFENRNCECVYLNMSYQDYSEDAADILMKVISDHGADLAFIDSYYVNGEYILKLKQTVKVVCFYCKAQIIKPDALINYNVDYDALFYKKYYRGAGCMLILGTKYVPLRPEFKAPVLRKEPLRAKKLLFLTGGSDPKHMVDSLVSQIKDHACMTNYEVTVVIGNYSAHCQLESEIPENIKLICATDKMAELMQMSDIAVSAGGTTMYELCALGVPSIIYAVAQNQVSESKFLGERGYVKYVGRVENDMFWDVLMESIDMLAESLEQRKRMSAKMLSLVDHKGCTRIVKQLAKLWTENEI